MPESSDAGNAIETVRTNQHGQPEKTTHSNPKIERDTVFHLAIESSTRSAGICVLEDDIPISSGLVEGVKTTSSELIPEISAVMRTAKIQPRRIGLVSVSIGPGSFTGLRISVMIAKTLAYALNDVTLVGVDTHEVIAQQGIQELTTGELAFSSRIATIINAQRGQWFVSLFDGNVAPLRLTTPNQILAPAVLANRFDGPLWMCGPGLVDGTAAELECSDNIRLCPKKTWQPTAEMVGRIGWSRYQRGDTTDPWRLNPVYGRSSAAEEKLSNIGQAN